MNLKSLIQELQQQRLNDSDAALKNIANSEKYLQQAYEGRYLFELIQNVRDANKQVNASGSVVIELKEGVLTVSNSGSPFNERGINSITTIGDSPKESQEFIGFKGIGFKSVHEVSDTPHIVTEWGAIVFDKRRSRILLNNRNFRDRDIPLFFIPHFHEDYLTEEEQASGIVTKVVLPLKSTIDIETIENGFNNIGIHQLLLLGNLEHIELRNGNTRYQFTITEEKLGKVVIAKNGQAFAFKHFKPKTKIPIPLSIIETLEDKEREIYEKDPFVDISLLFDLDKDGRLLPNPQSKLYLFYPTEITSGFNFIIHSYFLVSPDRKGLRLSQLNHFILQQIADYIAGEWLAIVKKNRSGTFLDFLVFSRNNESPILNHLYDRLVERLKYQKFLFDRYTKRYYNSTEVIIADGFDKGLFPDNQLNGKRLIYLENKGTRDWLLKEFGIEYLSFVTIADNIEKECVRQKNKKNFKFFENLYRYLVEYDDLNLKDRKVLLTSKLRLLSSEDYVFYGLKEKIEFPSTIDNRINFIHPAIRISDQRQGKGQTGFVEYNTELLVRRLLRLYDDAKVPKIDILSSLLKLNITERLFAEIRSKILLPVKGNNWVNPVHSAVYIETEELIQLYPEESFIDMSVLRQLPNSEEDLIMKLKQLGAWEIPGLYFSNKHFTVNPGDMRYQYIQKNIRSFSTPFFIIYGDWLIDQPRQVTKWFTDTVIANWAVYCSRITDETNIPISYKSQTSDRYDVNKSHWIYLSGTIKYLREERWIRIEGQEQPFKVQEIVGIDPIESIQVSSLLFKKYLYALEIHHASNRHFIQILGISHLDGQSFSNFKQIFLLIHRRYQANKGPDKEFMTFYNKAISKLFDFYFLCDHKERVIELKDCPWLGINDISQRFEWRVAQQLYYIEDKPAYDILPDDIKQIIQPHFTNRDKNRFGQIGKKIGLNFKQAIEQRLVNVTPINTVAIWEWLPSFSQSIALIEVLLETNLDTRLEELKATKVTICNNFDVELFKDERHISTVSHLSHKIERTEIIQIYVRQRADIKENIFHANVLHDLMVEMLSRDMHTVRLTLNDFYSRSSKQSFIDRYEVTSDRVDEIEARLKGFSISKVQSFWLTILQMKNIADPKSFFIGSGVDFAKLFPILKIDNDPGIEMIDYDRIYKIENLRYLQLLFTGLQIEISVFNDISDVKIDFKDYFLKQLEGLRFRFRKNFEIILHDYLADKPTEQKSSFQDLVDEYTNMSDQNIPGPLLNFDFQKYFFSMLYKAYPHLVIADAVIDARKFALLEKYQLNERAFKKAAKFISVDSRLFDRFLELNTNRSLLYFDGMDQELERRFRDFHSKTQDNDRNSSSETEDCLARYTNLPDAKIEELSTASVILPPKGAYSSNGSKGRRIDGSSGNPDAELSGIVGEKLVYEMLSRQYPEAEWISRNSAKAGVNPEGSDLHACDIKYIDENGQPHYVEVKSTTTDEKHFFVTFPEYNRAIKEQHNYHFYLVLFSLENSSRRILHLGNIFMLEDDQELFNNNHFTANFNNLEIRFQ